VVAPDSEARYERGLCAFQFERLVEYAFALRWIAVIYPRTLLDVGTGRSSLATSARQRRDSRDSCRRNDRLLARTFYEPTLPCHPGRHHAPDISGTLPV